MGLKSKDTRARKHARLDLSGEKILTINTRDTRRRKDLRQHLTTEERSLVKTRETRGRKSIRESLGQEEKQSLRSRETKGKMNIRKAVKKKCTDIDFVANRFRQSIKEGPFYVCCCCRRMLYRHSVLCYSAARYKKTSKTLLESCCSRHSSLQKTYICKTCDLSLKKNKMPTQAEANNLQFDDVPEALQYLCPLEESLISQRLPFMQIAILPRGGQKGIRGAVVNVPARLDTIAKTLPRMPMTCGLVPVKLKKKLEYRGHSMYQSIRPDVVLHALHTLKENNPLYEDVDLDTDWLNKCMEEEEELCAALIEAEQQLNTSDEESEEESPEKSSDDKEDDTEENAERLRGIPYNTCLQPACEFPEGSVITFAPGEGEHPVSLMTDNQCEVLAFPSLFPSGKFGHYDPSRPVKLPYRRYFNQRLLNEDRRCASNVEYLFYAQYFTELKQVLDNISFAVRLCKPGQKTAASIKNSIQDMIRENDAYRFLQTVRGSHPYWKRTLHDLCAMVRQLDIPTWFITFSAADLMWAEPIQIIARQQGVLLTEEEVKNLDWQEKCRWIRSNPVTAARHFDYRAPKFINNVMLSEPHPVGEIVDYFYPVKFQQRGSPHLHCLFWVKDAPKLGKNTEQDVCHFIDRYVSCKISDPNIELELQKLVTKVQRHLHSATCTKSGKGCRFHFPKAPTSKTMIADVANIESQEPNLIKIRKEQNATILKQVYDCMAEHEDLTFDDLLHQAEVAKNAYLTALHESTSSPTVIPAREPSDCFINNYSPDLLGIWQANMDIQYVTDPFACAMYILSYITKGEKQMGELLKRAAEQSKDDDSIRQQIKAVGNIFLTHREVSAQEAAYRVLSIPLKKSSRAVIFVNTSMLGDRICILKPQNQLRNLPDESVDIYQVGILERYAARPASLEDTSLADFATSYKLKASSSNEPEDIEAEEEEEEVTSTKIQLQLKLGTMYKRRRRAVLRTPRFSRVKQPESFFSLCPNVI